MVMDRISYLHHSIRSQILSYLPTDAALRTKILSKRWQYLWIQTQELVFCQTSQNTGSYVSGITQFIDNELPLETKPKITKYELHLTRPGVVQSSLDNGIRAAILREVKDVILDFHNSTRYDYLLPDCLFYCKSLERLTLRHHSFIERFLFCWISLKALTIDFATLDNHTISRILDGCRNLEHLELKQCRGFDRITADFMGCLRKMVIIQCENYGLYGPSESKLVISAPKVECLIVKRYKRLELIDVSSLVDVTVDLRSLDSDRYFKKDVNNKIKNFVSAWYFRVKKDWPREYSDRLENLMDILSKVGHAERVRLGTSCVKVVSASIMRGLPCVISLPKCKCLELETPVRKSDIPGILRFLTGSPLLETLIIHRTTEMGNNAQFLEDDKNVAVFDYEKTFPQQFLKQLKHVRIVGLSTQLIDFVQVLLNNATLLRKMEIITKSNGKGDEQSVIVQNIMRLPRSSPYAQIVIS